MSQPHYGCSTARNRGTGNNLLTLRRHELEAKVLNGLRLHLMHPEMVRTFVAEYHRDFDKLNPQAINKRTKADVRTNWRASSGRLAGDGGEAMKDGLQHARDEG